MHSELELYYGFLKAFAPKTSYTFLRSFRNDISPKQDSLTADFTLFKAFGPTFNISALSYAIHSTAVSSFQNCQCNPAL